MVLAWSVQHKRGTVLEWLGPDPILKAGQIGFEYDGTYFSKAKVGNGVNVWSALPYFSGNSVLSVVETLNRISVDNTDPLNPIIDIDPQYDAAITAAIAAGVADAKAHADALVMGLVDDRGNYNPATNSNLYPSSNGSGTAGAILKGDLYLIGGLGLNVTALIGTKTVQDGDTVRALADTPGQTEASWQISEANLGYVPENAANKQTDLTPSSTKYPNVDAVITGLATKQNSLGYTAENAATKDASDGYSGLTLFKINFKNALGTFISFITNANTAARTYIFQDRDGTIADNTDLALKANLATTIKILAKGIGVLYNHTGTTAETIMYSVLIPANTLTSGDILRLHTRVFKVTTTSGVNVQVYVNSSNSLSGAVRIAKNTNNATTTLLNGGKAEGVMIGGFTTNALFSRYKVSSSTTNSMLDLSSTTVGCDQLTFAWDTTVDQYLIIAGTLGNAAETMTLGLVILEKL